MRDKSKKIISIFAAAALVGTMAMTAGCGEENFKGSKLEDYVSSQNEAKSNGGFAVEKDGFVYFINGAESYTESNEYGDVVKGSLMRISLDDLNAGNYSSVKTVVPMLIVSQNFDSGIYIYGDYVYYATPTTDKNVSDGSIQNDWIDFKRAKLDGSEAMGGYYFRLENNAANYRYVQEGETVYCLYEEGDALKSYNTATQKTTVLVSGADSEFFYDETTLTEGTVYYTMKVPRNNNGSDVESYTQLYKVNASDVVEKTEVKNGTASYTVKGGKTYSFDVEKSEENFDDFDKNDYTTYPYVNLGDLVLDGIGVNNVKLPQNDTDGGQPKEASGYTYTIQRVQNGGVYFTRSAVVSTGSEGTPVYFVSGAAADADSWKTVDGNEGLTQITDSSETFSAAVIDANQNYYYLNGSTLCRVVGGVETEMAYNLSGITLWKQEGNYLYYYATGTNGNNLSRINCTGAKEDYNTLMNKQEYKPVTFAFIDWNSSWYKPEFIGNKVLYSSAQSYGGTTAYNYVYAADVSLDNVALKALNEKYDEVIEYMDDYSDDADMKAALTYIFRTGEKTLLDDVQDLYEETLVKEYTAFANHEKSENKAQNDYSTMFKDGDKFYDRESYYIGFVGEMKSADEKAIQTDWASSLPAEKVTEEKSEFPVWAIVLIVIGGVIVVATAVIVPVIVIRKKKQAAAEREATVNAYKRKKIDTTDDKSIDVYADETAETPAEEAAEAPAQEAETPVEEVAEAPAQEAVAEEENQAE